MRFIGFALGSFVFFPVAERYGLWGGAMATSPCMVNSPTLLLKWMSMGRL